MEEALVSGLLYDASISSTGVRPMPEMPLSSSYPERAPDSSRSRRAAARAALCRFLRPFDMH